MTQREYELQTDSLGNYALSCTEALDHSVYIQFEADKISWVNDLGGPFEADIETATAWLDAHAGETFELSDELVNLDLAPKVWALMQHLDETDPDEIETCSYDSDTLTAHGDNYLVCTSEEADTKVYESIAESLWAFHAPFIAIACGLPSEAAEMILSHQEQLCEGANLTIRALIDNSCGLDDFVENAIGADGRGHFLNSYDGNEYEVAAFFIYQR